MKNFLKTEIYDQFQCIADRCSYTCCAGWDINVDEDTYLKWRKNEEKIGDVNSNVKIDQSGDDRKYYIKMGHQKCCPFLDKKGLCNIVLTSGEEYLPKICDRFPRLENDYNELNEFSLSCACPAVVDIINDLPENIKFIFNGGRDIKDKLPTEYFIREIMISIMQNSKFTIKDRILLVFQMLLSIKNELVTTRTIMSGFQEDNFLNDISEEWKNIKIDSEDTLFEINELFLDIVSNYKNEKHYRQYLNSIAEYAETFLLDISAADIHDILKEWNGFKVEFQRFDRILENTIVLKIFSNCINKEIDDMIMQYQMLITEYIMVKYSVFLLWMLNEKGNNLDYCMVRDDIVIYTRIIENNLDGMREFWEDSFDEAIWDLGYLLLLLG